MQKYLHLLQIVETEKTVAKQLRRQIEDGEIEIERLKAEVTTSRTWPRTGSWRGRAWGCGMLHGRMGVQIPPLPPSPVPQFVCR